MNEHAFRKVAVLATLVVLALAVFSTTGIADSGGPGAALNQDQTTVITVNSGTDPDNSKSKTCLSATPCTLRRAIVQARLLAPAERPVLINFDIPATADEGYDSALGIWKIETLSTSDPSVFRTLEGGEITIDGSTQPGGRAQGPKIFIVGPGTGNRDGLIVGVNNAGAHDANVIKGLGFQNFRTHLIVNSNDNLIEWNWFGLSDNGQQPWLRNDDPQDGSGAAGVALSANVEDNILQYNAFLGFDGVAAAIRGDGNSFLQNFVGTTAAGVVPNIQTDPSLICSPVDWLGGGGVSLEGDHHSIRANTFAGLRQQIFQASTQPDAIRVTGTDHDVEENNIGVDADDQEVGVCGRGIYMADSPKRVQLTHNIIVNPGLSGISLNGPLYDANTLRRNIIKSRTAWPQVEGNPKAEDAIQLGPSLPDDFVNFRPARVTRISGRIVTGEAGVGSPCPNCVVELFLDDTDGVKEALRSLAVVQADATGNWTTMIPFRLSLNQGLRTTSTSVAFNTIPNMSAGTTSGLSGLYTKRTVYLPKIMQSQ